MGIFDDIKRMVTGNAPSRAARAPPSATPGVTAGLAKAQQTRRAAGVRGADGKVLTDRRLKKYERLERVLVADAGAFPWTTEQARAALARRGFDRAHVDAYLASPAARRLLE